MSLPSRSLCNCKHAACGVVVLLIRFLCCILLFPVFFNSPFFILMLLLAFFLIPFFILFFILLLYFCLFVDYVNRPIIFVFGAFVYHLKNTISLFVTTLSPLNVMNRLTFVFASLDGPTRICRMIDSPFDFAKTIIFPISF